MGGVVSGGTDLERRTLPPGGTADPNRHTKVGHRLVGIGAIAVLIVLGFFPKWQLALIVILLFFFAIGWSVRRQRRQS